MEGFGAVGGFWIGWVGFEVTMVFISGLFFLLLIGCIDITPEYSVFSRIWGGAVGRLTVLYVEEIECWG